MASDATSHYVSPAWGNGFPQLFAKCGTVWGLQVSDDVGRTDLHLVHPALQQREGSFLSYVELC